jgi:Cytochrome P460
LRAQLANDIAIKAYRDGKLPFPDGSIIVALHWDDLASEENNKVFGRAQSFIAGFPRNIQFMVKDSQNMPRRAAGDSLILPRANLPTRRCTKPASTATSPSKLATLSSPVTHLETRSEESTTDGATSTPYPNVRHQEKSALGWMTGTGAKRPGCIRQGPYYPAAARSKAISWPSTRRAYDPALRRRARRLDAGRRARRSAQPGVVADRPARTAGGTTRSGQAIACDGGLLQSI